MHAVSTSGRFAPNCNEYDQCVSALHSELHQHGDLNAIAVYAKRGNKAAVMREYAKIMRHFGKKYRDITYLRGVLNVYVKRCEAAERRRNFYDIKTGQFWPEQTNGLF